MHKGIFDRRLPVTHDPAPYCPARAKHDTHLSENNGRSARRQPQPDADFPMLIFVAVPETGSLTRAAERLGLAKTMVRKHMQRHKAKVGASLPLGCRAVSLKQAGPPDGTTPTRMGKVP